jgi:hypothetical protein
MTGQESALQPWQKTSESQHGRARRPRVLFVGPLPPPLGGVQLVIEMTLKSSLAQDHEIRTVNTSKDVLRWAVEKATWRTIPYFIRDLWRLVTTLLRWPPDVVIVHTAQNYAIMRDWIMMLVPRVLGRKVICHYHGTLHTVFPSPRTAFGRLAGRLIMAPASNYRAGPYLSRSIRASLAAAMMWCGAQLRRSRLVRCGGVRQARRKLSWLAPGERGILLSGGYRDQRDLGPAGCDPAVLAQHPEARFLLCGGRKSGARGDVAMKSPSGHRRASHADRASRGRRRSTWLSASVCLTLADRSISTGHSRSHGGRRPHGGHRRRRHS